MHVHRREKNADLLPRARRRAVRKRGSRDQHAAVRRREHDVVCGRRRAFGIAKEECKETGEREERNRDGPADSEAGEQRDDQGAADERQAGGVEAHAGQGLGIRD